MTSDTQPTRLPHKSSRLAKVLTISSTWVGLLLRERHRLKRDLQKLAMRPAPSQSRLGSDLFSVQRFCAARVRQAVPSSFASASEVSSYRRRPPAPWKP